MRPKKAAGEAGALAGPDLVLDGIAEVALRLARRLMAIDVAEAERIEAVMVAVIDPTYEQARQADPMLALLAFCEDMRAITGLPALPHSADE